MKQLIPKQVTGFPFCSAAFPADRSPKAVSYIPYIPSTQCRSSPIFNYSKLNSVIGRMNKFGEKMDNFAQGIREHVRIGPKLTETVKGKLRLWARILQLGGVEKIFRQYFSVKEGEKLLKASQCYLSTTTSPIAGLLFISADKVAFCSERSIKLSSPTGDVLRIHYKVLIPIRKIRRTNQSENVKKPLRKYIEIVTKDNFEFWFMGFLNYQKTLRYLHQAVSQGVYIFIIYRSIISTHLWKQKTF